MTAPGPLLFYSAWGLGYHNPEAERKALAFARAGYDTVYVAGIGIRNPRLSSGAKLADRVREKLAGSEPAPAGAASSPLRSAGLLVAPPRQVAAVRDVNVRLLERQLRGIFADWRDAVAWVRWPTPELVDALARLRPAAIVYECVDGYHETPGITGRWVPIFERAERKLAAMADAVVVPGPSLAEHFRAMGVEPVLLPHGVDLFDWREPKPRGAGAPARLGFVGTLDYRLDIDALRLAAERHSEWLIELIGPVQEGFDPGRFDGLGNVTIGAPIPHERLGEILRTFDAGVMPYIDDPVFRHMSPLKNLELMAAGKPAVTRRSPALDAYEGLLYFAATPEEFVSELERALAEDTPELARRRRALAEENTWARRLEEMLGLVAGLRAPR